jgi:hypothetical protein
MDYEQEYEQYSKKHMSRSRLIAGKCIKYTAYALIYAVIALVLWRVLFSGHVPGRLKTLSVNQATYDAYLSEGETLTMYTQELSPVNMDGETAGYFWVCQAVFIPEANQVQVLVRYSNSTLKHIARDFSLGEDNIPSRDEDVIDVTLALRIDPDPTNDTTTDRQTIRIQPSGEPIEDQTAMYNYRIYVFDNVPLDTAALINIAVDFYYIDSINYDRTPYSSIIVYETQYETKPVNLTARDKRALRAWAQDH